MKITEYKNVLLNETIFTEEFVNVLGQAGVNDITQLLQISYRELMDIPNFTFHMLREYREFLAKNGLDTK